MVERNLLAFGGSNGQLMLVGGRQLFIQQSIGQAIKSSSASAGNYFFRQGFLQPQANLMEPNLFDQKLKVSIFPNPAGNQINIRFDEPILEEVSMRWYSILGKEVFHISLSKVSLQIIPLPDIPPGTYMVILSQKNKFYSTRILKL